MMKITSLTDTELSLKEGGGFSVASLPEFLTSGRVGTLGTEAQCTKTFGHTFQGIN